MNVSRYRLLFKKLSLKLKRASGTPLDLLRLFFAEKPDSQEKQLIFVGTVMHARIARIAKWLKRHNKLSDYKFILICDHYRYSNKLTGDLFDEVHLYTNQISLRYQLKKTKSNNSVYHLFGPPYDAIKIALKHINLSKAFFDYQDLLVSNFGLNPPFDYMREGLKVEQQVISSVRGIICHSLELQSAKNHFGNFSTPSLYFPNYADNDAFIVPKNKFDQDNIHIVYAGSVYSAFRNSDYFGSSQLHWLIELFEKQKIHFHIYPSPVNNQEELVDYFILDEECEYFHFHKSVSQKELGSTLAKYDFGILPFFNSKTKRIIDKRKYSTTLKLFNFIESGLPIIVSEDVLFQEFLARKYNASIKVSEKDLANLKEVLSNINYQNMTEEIKKRREELSLQTHISSLVNFYFD